MGTFGRTPPEITLKTSHMSMHMYVAMAMCVIINKSLDHKWVQVGHNWLRNPVYDNMTMPT